MINKPIKWATQRASPKLNKPYKVQKKSQNPNQTRSGNTKLKEEDSLVKLEKELAFTYDTMATITVHYESLYHAYCSSKQKLDQSKTETRLCEMEKELLTAYDDLGLQVNHLERNIFKLEKRMKQLKEEEAIVSSPCSSSSESEVSSNQSTPCMNYTYEPLCYEQPTMFETDIIYNQQYYYEPILFM